MILAVAQPPLASLLKRLRAGGLPIILLLVLQAGLVVVDLDLEVRRGGVSFNRLMLWPKFRGRWGWIVDHRRHVVWVDLL